MFLTTAAGVSAVSLAGCPGAGEGGDNETLTTGYSNFTNGIPFEVMVRKATEWYAEDKDGIELISTAADGSIWTNFEQALRLMERGAIAVDKLVDTSFSTDNPAEGFEAFLQSKTCNISFSLQSDR